MTQHDIYVMIVDLKTSIPEEISLNSDGSYTIFLNARYTYERQQEALRHAYSHIEESDFEKECVQEIEMDAHERGKE